MARLDLELETSLSPQRVRDALLDFSERRPDIWPGLERSLYHVYSVSETSADVKEGTKAPLLTVWARELYDFSDPDTVRWTVQESNFSTPGDYVAVTLHPRAGGGTRLQIEWSRTGANLKGRLVVKSIVMSKGRPILSSVKQALDRLEQQQATTP